jgi:hypothetical protein
MYYDYLDEIRGERTVSALAASLSLAAEFPNLRWDEAKAVFRDWKDAYSANARSA